MGKGDRKTLKGKRYISSYGNARKAATRAAATAAAPPATPPPWRRCCRMW